MLHPELLINGKPWSDTQEIDTLFQLDTFACEIEYTWLSVEFSSTRAAFIGWGDEFSDTVYYFDNGSHQRCSVDLLINVCPQERMLCYDTKALKEIVTYFCQTGQRCPKYNWIEDTGELL